MKRFPMVLLLLAAGGVFCSAQQAAEKAKFRYVRKAGGQTRIECEFLVERSDKWWSIGSLTQRGKVALRVQAKYAKDDQLTSAKVELKQGDVAKVATVEVKAGKAQVQAGGKVTELEVPAGVIVTSAPDWTDTFMLCRRYDRAKKGKQERPGLWVHPEKASFRLTLTVERQGTDTIEHAGKKLELDRLSIRLRGNSAYVAWADREGRMIKLVSVPFQPGKSTEMYLEGYEKSAAGLKPK